MFVRDKSQQIAGWHPEMRNSAWSVRSEACVDLKIGVLFSWHHICCDVPAVIAMTRARTRHGVQLLKVFFPDTSELERRKLAAAVPPSILPAAGLYDAFNLGDLQSIYAKNLPKGKVEYRKVMWEGVRQLLGTLGLGDHLDEDRRSVLFDMLDMTNDSKVRFFSGRWSRVNAVHAWIEQLLSFVQEVTQISQRFCLLCLCCQRDAAVQCCATRYVSCCGAWWCEGVA
jgi:hypothetical protein